MRGGGGAAFKYSMYTWVEGLSLAHSNVVIAL